MNKTTFGSYADLSENTNEATAYLLPPAIVVLASFPFVYVLYVIVLMYHTYSHCSEVEIRAGATDESATSARYLIYYEKKTRTKNASSFMSSIFQGNSVMVIEITRADDLKKCAEDSTPVVEFEINNVVFRTGVPQLGGRNPEWFAEPNLSSVNSSEGDNKEENDDSGKEFTREDGGKVLVPLRKVQLARPNSTFKVTVLDPYKKESNAPKVYGTCDIDINVVRNWIAGSRYEGKIKLDKSDGDDTGTLHVNVHVKRNNYLIDLLDPSGASKRREEAEKIRAKESQRNKKAHCDDNMSGWKKKKKGGMTLALNALGGEELYLDGGNETPGGGGDIAADNNEEIIRRILSTKGVRKAGEKLPDFFRAREIIEGVDLVFDEVDKDSIFDPIVRTADTVDKALGEMNMKLDGSDERAARFEETLDDIGDMVEAFKSGHQSSHEQISKTLQEDIAAKDDISRTSTEVQKSLQKMEAKMVRGKEVSDLQNVMAEVGDQLLGQFKATDDRIDSFKTELHRGRKVSAEELAHQKAVDERMDKVNDAITMLREELMKIRRNL